MVADPETGTAAIIDPVLDFDPKSGATGVGGCLRMGCGPVWVNENGLRRGRPKRGLTCTVGGLDQAWLNKPVLGKDSPHGVSLALMARTRRVGLPLVIITSFDETMAFDQAHGPVMLKPVEGRNLAQMIWRELDGVASH